MNKILIDGLSFSLPLFIMAIGGIYSERSGVTNLSLEGFQGFGAFLGAFMAVFLSGKMGVGTQTVHYLSFVFALLGGMLLAGLMALMAVGFKANQTITGVVMNILALAVTSLLTKTLNKAVFGAASDKFVLEVSERYTIPVLSDIPVIGGLFQQLYPYTFIIIVLAFIAWYVLYKTRYGMNLRACGDNPHAVDAAGVNVSRVRVIAVLVSGALSGIAGMCFAYSTSSNFSSSLYVGYGYLAIAAMIFGNWKILPTLASCLLFGFARSAGYYIVVQLQLPSSYQDLIMILPYVLTLLLLVFFSKHNRAPRALGEIYDKGKR